MRTLNIINAATKLGFEFNNSSVYSNIANDAENFLIENAEWENSFRFEQCTLNHDGRSQYFTYEDKEKNELGCSGDIFGFGDNDEYYEIMDNGDFEPRKSYQIPVTGKERNNFIFVFATIVESNGEVVKLYDHLSE